MIDFFEQDNDMSDGTSHIVPIFTEIHHTEQDEGYRAQRPAHLALAQHGALPWHDNACGSRS